MLYYSNRNRMPCDLWQDERLGEVVLVAVKKRRWFRWIEPSSSESKNCLKIFCIAAIVATLLFLPFVLYDHGLFLFYGDYNVQQIPFYQLAHDAVRDGNMGWSYTTDLGANFIASYSFYLLGSPFFWLTIPFPSSWVPYLMAPLFVLKFAVAALTSYAFIRRFTKTAESAMIGALLYAFSGYMIYNIFYNHFLDVVALFPLLLIGLEELVVNNRRGYFALAVSVNLLLNYYFFVGEVVFLVLYFLMRCTAPGFTITWRKFGFLALESLLGGLMGMILFLPSAFMVLQNPRVAHMLTGYDMLFYDDVQRYGLILQSLFFPPDMPACPNFFPDSNAKWYSVAAYMPLFGMAGVLTFLREKKKNWLKYLLLILGVMMFIPFLNSAFNGFNASYYARWFYMLTLMLSLATAQTLENPRMRLDFGIKVSLAVTAAFALIGVLPSVVDGEMTFFSMPNYPVMFWISVCLALGGIFATALLALRRKKFRGVFYRASILCLCGFILVYGMSEITFGKTRNSADYYQDVVDRGLNASFQLDESEFFRTDVYYDHYLDNWPMFWGLPSMQAFQSTVPASIMTFYDSLGIQRDVASRIDPSYYGLRELLSVKYCFVENNEGKVVQDPDLPPGFVFYDHQDGFDIYENEHFVPMGFSYDYYIDEQMFENCSKSSRDKLLLKGVCLTDEQIEEYNDLLSPLPSSAAHQLSDEDLLQDADTLRENACDSFVPDNDGFTATIDLDSPHLVFFSIPYESGWQATVNGEPVDVEQVDSGMMAVRCEAGENTIRFDYHTPGLTLGITISIIGVILYVLYLIWNRRLQKKKPQLYGPDPNGIKRELKLSYTAPLRSDVERSFRLRNEKKRKEQECESPDE